MIVTANRRIARTLRSRKDSVQTWDEFIDSLFRREFPKVKIASSIECHWIWKQILKDTHISLGIAGDKTLQAIEEAYELIQMHGISLEQLMHHKADADFFVEIALEFETILAKHGKIAECAKLKKLCQVQSLRSHLNDKEIYFYGFVTLSTLQKKIISLLQENGVSICFDELENKNQSIKKIKFDSLEEELESVLNFSKEIVISGKRMGIIVPNLEKNRNQIEKKLLEIFEPDAILPSSSSVVKNYRFSLGNPLLSYASIQFLINSLELCLQNPTFALWSNLLRSPFITGFFNEISERSLFDIELRKLNQKYISWEKILSMDKIPPLFKEQCENVFFIKNSMKNKRTLSEWRIFVKDWGHAWGWPGQNQDQEILDLVNATMEKYEVVDDLQEKISFEEFFEFFKKMLSNTLYQPAAKETALEVMGFLEAICLDFDLVWILGMTDLAYPPAPSPNPFIPIHVQIEYDFPRSHAKREANICAEVLKKIVDSSPHVFVSYSQHDESGELVCESPLIESINLIKFSCISSQCKQHFYRNFNGIITEKLEHKLKGLPYSSKNVKGGISVLKDQIACPFKSYLKHRLGVHPLEFPQMGIDLKTKGILIHEALETIFNKIKNKSDLFDLDEGDIKKAINEVIANKAEKLNDLEKNIEASRLYLIVEKLIVLEKGRVNFNIIGLEHKIQWNYQEHCFSFKVDRIDQTEKGDYILIDYKTGNCDLKNLSLECMDDPQLPLYAISMSQSPGAVVYCSLKREDLKFKGIGLIDEPWVDKYSPDEWADFLNQWKDKIEQTARSFLQGDSMISPKYGENTCKKCDFYSGCPVREMNNA